MAASSSAGVSRAAWGHGAVCWPHCLPLYVLSSPPGAQSSQAGWFDSLPIPSWRGCKNHIKGEVLFNSRVWKESCLTYEIGIETVELPLFQKAQRINSWRNLKHIIFDTSISQRRNLNLEIRFAQYHDCSSELAFLKVLITFCFLFPIFMSWVLKAGVLGKPPFVLRLQRTKPVLDNGVLGKKPFTNPPGTPRGTNVPMPGPGVWMMAARCSSFMKTLNVITYFFMSKMYISTFFLCRQVSLLLQSSGQMFLV